MKRKILRQIAKTRMQQEGFSLHRFFKRYASNSSGDKKKDKTQFGMCWRKYAEKGIIPMSVLNRRRRLA